MVTLFDTGALLPRTLADLNRNHCSSKLHRLRQVTGLTSGKGKVYKQPAPVTLETANDVRWVLTLVIADNGSQLQLLLFSAERALAHSHEAKALAGKANAPSSARRDQISWLRRALKCSASLHSIAQGLEQSSPPRLSQQCLAEITIYHLSIRSETAFERSQYAEVLADLAARRRLLNTLADAARDSYQQALAVEFMDAYDPLIRFSAYKLGRADSHDIDGVVGDIDDDMIEDALPGLGKLVAAVREETNAAEMDAGRRTLEAVVFAGDKVEFRNAELVDVMLRVQDALGKLKRKTDTGKGRGMKGWDHVLGVLGEAEDVARRLVNDHEASGSSASLRSNRTTQSLSLAHQYIIFHLLSNRIRRDLLLVENLAPSSALPADVSVLKLPGSRVKVEEAVKGLAATVKLYDTVLQSLNQLRSLAIVEEKEGVRRAAEGVEAYFHGTRCFHLARLHCLHPTPSFASATELLARSSDLLRRTRELLFGMDVDLQEEVVTITEAECKALEERVATLELAAKRALFGQTVAKPVFFDTAFNYVDLPMEELLKNAERGIPKTGAATNAKASTTPSLATPKPLSVAAAKTPVGHERRREATPTPAAEASVESPDTGKPKKWLGGWFGRS